ncbi:ABC transporter permease [Ramlibacter sp.]|uniref:ABC transporter permease n=1 Tax=Ramlibacter sp. TaxID=1917967 RepID=UPI003D10EAC4
MTRAAPLAIPPVLWLLAFWAWPLLLVFSMSFREMDSVTFEMRGFTLAHFAEVLTDGFHLDSVWRSIKLATLATLLSGVLGYPAALHIAGMRNPRLRATLTLVLLIPIMISLVVTGFAWILILGPNGLLNQVIQGTGLVGGPLQFLNSESGVLIVLVYSFGPYMVINIVTALDRVDPAVMRAAQVHGATPWQAFRRVTLPLSFPGMLSGGLIVFSLSAAAFVTPYIIGGNRVKVVPLQIYNAAVTTFDWPIAATLSVVLFILAMLVATGVAKLAERRFAGWLKVKA